MKPFLVILGFFFLALALLGVILPLMPTTCFVLAAAACFGKSSERFYQWLLASRVFGPMIRDWQATRSMPRRAKRVAITSILCAGTVSLVLLESGSLQLLVLALLLVPIGIILKLPTTEELTPLRNHH
ncbi:hypothetical protein Tel_03675 [Candidatus Tenderia electrophaga]|jgi:hypothetical protein|uniref:Inner membrane protein n=1 Tax=Candidatus Tenderia electrophaga TaxID=1748243 RepID=A0A0S2TAZ5_9GAMM|nr:hypothetical protein Tel_03675 [Candidatus Tenderia electrophaga]